MKGAIATAATAALAVATVGPAYAVKAPTAGEYLAQVYASFVSNNSACLVASGSSFTAIVNYGGLSGKTVEIRTPAAPSSIGAMSVSNLTLTLTSGLGTAAPQGNSSITATNEDGTFSGKGTFGALIHEVTSKSFLVDLMIGYQVSGFSSGCSMDLKVALTQF
jgi:hypothetical protein